MKEIEVPSTTNRYYWVPENMLYATDGDCLDARPDDGAAALVVSHVAYEALEQKLAVAVRALEKTLPILRKYDEAMFRPSLDQFTSFANEAEEALALINPTKGDV